MRPLIGLEIGGTKLQIGLGDGNGVITRLLAFRVDPPRGAEGIRAQILDAFRSLGEDAAAAAEALGIGFGGPVDPVRGVVTRSHQIAGWDEFPLADWVRSALRVPIVAVQNDADTAALGEARFGAGAGVSPVLYVNSGSGIGGGLILDGAIYSGSGTGAMEIGHLRIEETDPDGFRSHIPRTLEDIASGWGIAAAARELAEREAGEGRRSAPLLEMVAGDPSRITAETVASAARAGSPLAGRVLARATTAMGRALAHAVTLMAPRRVILGGGVSLMDDDLWLDPIRRVLDERVFPPFRGSFDVVTAALGQDVVVHGALALARDAARSRA